MRKSNRMRLSILRFVIGLLVTMQSLEDIFSQQDQKSVAKLEPVSYMQEPAEYFVTADSGRVCRLPTGFKAFRAGDVVEGSFVLTNKTGAALTIKNASASCSCLKAQVRTGVTIENGEPFVVKYLLSVGKGESQIDQLLSLECEGAINQIIIEFANPVLDVALFLERLNTFTLDESKEDFDLMIRCVVTGSLQEKDLNVSATGDLAHLKWQFKTLKGEHFIVSKIRREDVSPVGLRESIRLECLKTKDISESVVQIFRPDSIRLTPAVLYLSPAEDGVHREGDILMMSELPDASEKIRVFVGENMPCNIEVKQLGKKVIRVKVILDSETYAIAQKGDAKVVLRVNEQDFDMPISLQ